MSRVLKWGLAAVILGAAAISVSMPRFSIDHGRMMMGDLRSDLKNLASAQYFHHEDHGSYVRALDSMDLRLDEASAITMQIFGDSGWIARGNHQGVNEFRSYRGFDCVVYHGIIPEVPRTTKQKRSPDGPMEVVCDFRRR